jgi:glutamate synthase (NADPH) large chain
MMQQPPGPIGLYDPRNEHDSCGVSFVANLKGVRSNELVLTGLKALTNMEHRGATGAEPDTGDGAGHLAPGPRRVPACGRRLRTARGRGLRRGYGVPARRSRIVREGDGSHRCHGRTTSGSRVLGWRELPIDPDCLGVTARAAMPTFKQLFVSDPAGATGVDLDRKAFVARKRSRRELDGELETYFASLSSRTIVYKGMLTTPQLSQFFP